MTHCSRARNLHEESLWLSSTSLRKSLRCKMILFQSLTKIGGIILKCSHSRISTQGYGQIHSIVLQNRSFIGFYRFSGSSRLPNPNVIKQAKSTAAGGGVVSVIICVTVRPPSRQILAAAGHNTVVFIKNRAVKTAYDLLSCPQPLQAE